jgi:nucleoside-specific outer membrane channel protein Tsx
MRTPRHKVPCNGEGADMNVKRLLAGAAFGLASMLAASQAWAFDFSDTSVSLTYGASYMEPGVVKSSDPNNGTPISKFILTLTHFDTYKYGTNFINVDALQSTDRDFANNSTRGATEVYVIYRGNLSGNAVLNTKALSFGPVADVRLEFGGDFNTKNTTFAPEKKLLIIGPNFAMDLPKGFLNLGFHFSKEWNNCGVCGIGNSAVSFSPAFEFEAVWLYPLSDYLGGFPLRFDGFFNLVTPKGKDGFGDQTKTEILTQPRLVLDVGALAFKKPNTLDGYVGYQFWLNKFGNNASQVPGSEASLVFVGTTFHF